MSGIYIPDMEMPKSCLDCGFKINCDECEGYECFCAALHRNIGYLTEVPSDFRLGDCPLIPVPPHGRLIDADAMQAEWFNLNFDRKISDGTLSYWNYRLSQMPTIIPAIEEGEG